MLSENNSRQEPSVTRKPFILDQTHNCDRFSIYLLTSKLGSGKLLHLSSRLLEEYDYFIYHGWVALNQYTAKYLPAELQLDQPAYVHPNLLAANPDISW